MNILSTSFAVVFIVFYILYWLLRNNLRIHNLFVLLVSYVFYSLIDWRFGGLLLFTSLSVYCTGLYFENVKETIYRKIGLISAIAINIGILFFFKYYNFFAGEFAQLLGINQDKVLLNLILPVGISFYTFTSLGYAIDVYQRKVKATKDVISVLSFITFFPLILSGPIERSDGLLVQFKKKRVFDYHLSTDGITQVVWGAFKKLVIADNIAVIVNNAFGNYENLPASSLIIGAFLYTFQIYFDFSGYSDIAIGISKLLGFKVRRNFHYPYFALNVADFWKRWHMSLQSWLMNYIYFPLGGSRCSKGRIVLNTLIVFTICGIWHGANWTFIVWGVYHGLLFIPLILFCSKEFRKTTVNEDRMLPSIKETGLMLFTFVLVTIGWILFNASSLGVGMGYIAGMFNLSVLSTPVGIGLTDAYYIFALLIITLMFEWSQRSKEHPFQFQSSGWIKVILLYVLVGHIIFCNAAQSDFIYYQF